MTIFEAQTGGAFDRLTGNIAGNLTKIFQKSQMPGGLPRGGMGGFGIDRYIITDQVVFRCFFYKNFTLLHSKSYICKRLLNSFSITQLKASWIYLDIAAF